VTVQGKLDGCFECSDGYSFVDTWVADLATIARGLSVVLSVSVSFGIDMICIRVFCNVLLIVLFLLRPTGRQVSVSKVLH
jgi:hypothetical protein